jgi:hypothetical protein
VSQNVRHGLNLFMSDELFAIDQQRDGSLRKLDHVPWVRSTNQSPLKSEGGLRWSLEIHRTSRRPEVGNSTIHGSITALVVFLATAGTYLFQYRPEFGCGSCPNSSHNGSLAHQR